MTGRSFGRSADSPASFMLDLVMREAARVLWAEPRSPHPPTRVWRDWVLVVALLASAAIEAVVGDDLAWPGLSVAVLVALVALLLIRRTHPLVAVTVVFSTIAIVKVASLAADVYWEGLNTALFVVLFPYALLRWGSGREVAIGMPVVLIPVALSWFDPVPVGTLLAGTLVLPFAAAIGAAVRYRDNARQRTMEQVKLLEREQLARELHDTVAHHVSAIIIRAQAGRVVASSDPTAALEALSVIEAEASRTLAEMRAMVGALRQGEEADLAPQRGIADIERLTNSADLQPHVEVELSGNLKRLRPSVDAAVYRLAQEAITNAIRHARHATRIRVAVHGDDDCVRLSVVDDGEVGAFDSRSPSGFGLIGMAERAKLLGGTLEAGPNHQRGWTVSAMLPRGRGVL
jgi:signal transduction histidine kinase